MNDKNDIEIYQEKLMNLVNEVKKDMKKADVPFDDTVPFFINKRLTTCLGKCFFIRKGYFNKENKATKIEISFKLLKNEVDQEIKNTICHELIHTFPKCIDDGHKGYWKLYADKMNKRNKNYKITTKTKTNNNNWNYTVICKCCGAKSFFDKKGKLIKMIENNEPIYYYCKKCNNSDFKIIYK